MSLKNPPKAPSSASRHMTYTTILGTYVTILGTILGLLFTWTQLRIAHNQEDRARRSEPLSYSLASKNTHYQYDIQQDGTAVSLPAPSLQLQVSHGSLHSITAISFDGTGFYELSSLPMQDSWNGCTVDITMPAQSVVIDGNLIYDYFFLFLEPTEGPCQLDLICNIISLDTQTVESIIYHPISLVQLEYLSEGPQQKILSVYAALMERFKDLDLLSE